MSFIKITDERLNVENLRGAKYAIVLGPSSNATKISPQNANAGTINYLLNNVGPNVGRNRTIWLNFKCNLTVVGTGLPATASGWAGYVGFKALPFNRCVQVQHNINTASDTYLNYQLTDWLGHLKNHAEEVDWLENFQPDTMNTYNSASTMNPIGQFTNVPHGRGVFKNRTLGLTVSNVSATGATFAVDIWEPLLTPFSSIPRKGQNLPALYGIDGENIAISSINQFSDMLAFGLPTGTVTSVTCAVVDAPIYVEYVSSKNLVIPENSVSQYSKFQRFTTQIGTIAASSSSSASVQINSQTMPSLIALMIKKNETSRTPTDTDSYAAITSVSFQLDNGSLLLNNYSQKQLHQISYQNGLTDDWAIFSQANMEGLGGNTYGAGSILLINPSKDLSISDSLGLSNCSAGKYTLNIDVNYKNNSNANQTNMILCAYVINTAILSRTGRSYETQQLAYTQNEINTAMREADFVDYSEFIDSKHDNLMLSGGSFSSWFSNVWNKGKAAVEKYKPLVEKGIKIAKKAKDIYDENKKKQEEGGAVKVYYH